MVKTLKVPPFQFYFMIGPYFFSIIIIQFSFIVFLFFFPSCSFQCKICFHVCILILIRSSCSEAGTVGVYNTKVFAKALGCSTWLCYCRLFSFRPVARALIGRGGGVYSYIQVLPD